MTARRLPATLLLAAGLWLVYFWTSSGGFESGDPVVRYLTAKSWLAGEWGMLPPEFGWQGAAVAPDGRVFTYFGPLQSILMVPFLLAARVIPLPGLDLSMRETFVISLGLFPVLSTLALVAGYRALLHLGFAARPALTAVAALGLGSSFWHYARMGQEEHLVALGYALWLLGAGRFLAGRGHGLTLMAAGAIVGVTTRWASLPTFALLGVASLWMLARRRRPLDRRDLTLAVAALLVALGSLLAYNAARFGAPFETGYSLLFGRMRVSSFDLGELPTALPALLVSPYRGLLFYSPVVVLAALGAFVRQPARARGPLLFGLGVFVLSLLVYSAYRFWMGGHAWGPRFLTSTQMMLLPALAAALTIRPRLAGLVAPLAALQVFSTVLPESTEEYVIARLGTARPGYCSPWRFACTAVPGRIGRGLAAFGNTLRNDPGVVFTDRPLVSPDVVLETSDYRTVYWWPVRAAFRGRAWDPRLGLAAALGGLAAGAWLLILALRRLPAPP